MADGLHPRTDPTAYRGVLLSVALVAIVLHACLISWPVLRGKGDFEWDPSNHALWGRALYDDLRHGNFLSLAYDTYRQIYWPPVHAWAMAFSLLIFGPTQMAARVVSLVAYYLVALLLGLFALRIGPKPRITAAITVALWLTAARFVARFATEAFTESLAIFMTAAAFVLFTRALARGTRRAWVVAGLAAMAVYLTKTDYGVMAIASEALVLGADSWRRRSPREPVAFLCPIAIVAVLWFLYPPKLLQTIQALQNRPYGPPRFSEEGLLYHFELIHHWSDQGWVFTALLVCLALSYGSARAREVQLALVYLSIALFLHEISQSKDEKHIVKVLPWLFLLAGAQASRLLGACATLARGGRNARAVAQSLAGATLVLAMVLRLPDLWALRELRGRYGTEPVRAAIVCRILPGRRHLVIGEPTELSPYMITWELLKNDDSRVEPDPLSQGGHPREWLEARLGPILARHPVLALIEHGTPGGTVYQIQHLHPKFPDTVSSDPATVLQAAFAKGEPDRILVVSVDEGSPWDRHEYRRYIHPGAPFALYLSRSPSYTFLEHRRFAGAFMDLWVFDRRATP